MSTDCLIAGEKGCGKTFAYLTYNYLSSFILKYKINFNNHGKEEELTHNLFSNIFKGGGLRKDSFKKIKKFFYFILPNDEVIINWNNLFYIFQFQVIQ